MNEVGVLAGRKQRTTVNESYISWFEILFGVPQGSLFGPVLFNIYINDILFSVLLEMINFADDNSPYNVNLSTKEVIENLEKQTTSLIEWYKNNYLKPSPIKCHLILSECDPTLSVQVTERNIFNIGHLFGCVIAEKYVDKLKKFRKEVYALFIWIMRRPLTNCLKNQDLLVYIIE